MTEKFQLEKSIWTHHDFDKMGWHDASIYGLTIQKGDDNWATDLIFDIDYIFKWVKPAPPSPSFTFWVAPCTLRFKKCFDLKIDIQTNGSDLDLIEIADLYLVSKVEQETNKFVYEWTIELQQGKITLKSFGLEQIVRQMPIHIKEQVLTLEERGGINFELKPY